MSCARTSASGIRQAISSTNHPGAHEGQRQQGHSHRVGKWRACAGQHQDQEVGSQQQHPAASAVAIEFDQAGIDRGQTDPGEKGRVPERGKAFAAAFLKQRPQAGHLEHCAGCD
jgi:hypothetical protein